MGVGVDDGVGGFAHRDGGVGGIEKVVKLMMSLHAGVDYRPIRHIEGGEQRRGACFRGVSWLRSRPLPGARPVPVRHAFAGCSDPSRCKWGPTVAFGNVNGRVSSGTPNRMRPSDHIP